MARSLSNKLIYLAVSGIILVNALLLGKMWLNRSVVLVELKLSERELVPPYFNGFAQENSAKRLSLQWTTPLTPTYDDWQTFYTYHNRSLTINEQHLASFDFTPCPQDYKRQQRSAWVLLEFNGQSYHEYLAQIEQQHAQFSQQLLASKQEIEEAPVAEYAEALKQLDEKEARADRILQQARHSFTRLFIVDAAASKALLQASMQQRARHSEGQLLILPAEIQLSYNRCKVEQQVTKPEIYINRLAVASFYVPKPLAEGLPKAHHNKANVHFTATIHYGKLAIPWLSDLQLSAADVAATSE